MIKKYTARQAREVLHVTQAMLAYYVRHGKIRKVHYNAYLAEDVDTLKSTLHEHKAYAASPVYTPPATYYKDKKAGRTQFALREIIMVQDAMVLAELRYLQLANAWPFVGLHEELPRKLHGIAAAFRLSIPTWTPFQQGNGMQEKYPLSLWEEECTYWHYVASETEWQLRQAHGEAATLFTTERKPILGKRSRKGLLYARVQERMIYDTFHHLPW